MVRIPRQQTMFGEDNLDFKIVNLPYSSKYVHLCSEFKLKKLLLLKLKLRSDPFTITRNIETRNKETIKFKLSNYSIISAH